MLESWKAGQGLSRAAAVVIPVGRRNALGWLLQSVQSGRKQEEQPESYRLLPHCPHWHHLSLSPTSQQVPLPSDRAPDLNLLTFAIIGMV